MRQRMGSLFNPGLKKLTRAASTFSKKATEFKESAKKSFQPEDKLKNPTKDFLKKGEKLISYDYTNKGDNPDHIDNNRFFASRFNLQNRVYYEEENGVKEKPNSIVFSEVKKDTNCIKGLKERGGQELETFVVNAEDVEPWMTLKPF